MNGFRKQPGVAFWATAVGVVALALPAYSFSEPPATSDATSCGRLPTFEIEPENLPDARFPV
jgi:hypothetical protein